VLVCGYHTGYPQTIFHLQVPVGIQSEVCVHNLFQKMSAKDDDDKNTAARFAQLNPIARVTILDGNRAMCILQSGEPTIGCYRGRRYATWNGMVMQSVYGVNVISAISLGANGIMEFWLQLRDEMVYSGWHATPTEAVRELLSKTDKTSITISDAMKLFRTISAEDTATFRSVHPAQERMTELFHSEPLTNIGNPEFPNPVHETRARQSKAKRQRTTTTTTTTATSTPLGITFVDDYKDENCYLEMDDLLLYFLVELEKCMTKEAFDGMKGDIRLSLDTLPVKAKVQSTCVDHSLLLFLSNLEVHMGRREFDKVKKFIEKAQVEAHKHLV
jgi:hypothetical protein